MIYSQIQLSPILESYNAPHGQRIYFYKQGSKLAEF